jgi:hypothetical protein
MAKFLIKHNFALRPYISVVADDYKIGAEEERSQSIPPVMIPADPELLLLFPAGLAVLVSPLTGSYAVVRRLGASVPVDNASSQQPYLSP